MARAKRGNGANRGNGVKRGNGGQVGYAVIGLGHIAQAAVLPAFEHARRSRLVAVVSGDEEKRRKLSRRYECRAYSYEQLDECLASDDVDAVYICLPNDGHLDATLAAAGAGKHVLCEKPMATSSRDCERMIKACRDADVRLMIAYRLHFEPANLEAVEAAKKKLGDLKFFSSDFSYQVKDDNIRVTAARGGGAIWDIGIYCLNAARYLFQAEPVEVMAMAARGKDERFSEVEEGHSVLLRFPGDRLATFNVSFGAAATATYRIVGSKGDLCLDQAYEYVGERERTLTIEERSTEKTYPQIDQFAPELEHFSDCVLSGREPEPNGEEGLADIRVIEAVLRSARTGRSVKVNAVRKTSRPSRRLEMRKAPVRKVPLVNAEAASQ
jgi:predicted dehydrogenase